MIIFLLNLIANEFVGITYQKNNEWYLFIRDGKSEIKKGSICLNSDIKLLDRETVKIIGTFTANQNCLKVEKIERILPKTILDAKRLKENGLAAHFD